MTKQISRIIFSILLGLLNLSIVLVIRWASYRGFDLSDESFYYLGYRYFDNTPDLAAASFHSIYGRFFSFLDLSLTGVRLLRLVLTLLASFILYIGIEKLKASDTWMEKIILFNIILGGMLLSYSWAPLALSYNSMSSLLIGIIVGFWLLSLRTKGQCKIICWLLLGGLFVLLFFIKASNLTLFPLIMFATLYWRYTQGLRKKQLLPSMSNTLAFTLGILCMLIFVSGGIGSIPETLDIYLQQLFGLADTGSSHTLSALWIKYYVNAEMVFQKLKYPVFGLFLAYLLTRGYFTIKKDKASFWPTAFFKFFGIILFVAFLIQNEYWKGGTPFKYKMLIPYIFILVFVILNQSIESKKINFVLLLSLLSIPIAGAIGTNNGLSAQVLFYGVFIFLVIYYSLSTSDITWFKHLILSLLLLLGTSHVISGTVLRPYRLFPLAENTLKLNGIPDLNNLKVDTTVFELSENLKFLRAHNSEYIFAYSGMLGVNPLADKKPYSLEWFNEGDDEKMCAIIKKSKISPENILFLIPEEIPLTVKIISCLEDKGILFNAEYSKIKSFEFFYPRSNKNITLNVYQYTSK